MSGAAPAGGHLRPLCPAVRVEAGALAAPRRRPRTQPVTAPRTQPVTAPRTLPVSCREHIYATLPAH
jgi:hypothetical protein